MNTFLPEGCVLPQRMQFPGVRVLATVIFATSFLAAMVFFVPKAGAQVSVPKKQVTGLVQDSAGVTIPGVSIGLKGRPGIGTSSDMNGRFILALPGANEILVFNAMGFDTQEIPIAGKDIINVTMRMAKANAMTEVVVVAYGKQKKADVIGAITSINPSELKVPSSNLTTALAGRLAGVIAYQRSGEPGADDASFFIRGVTTFGYKKDPLILIDGVELPTTELSRLQPDDIASFSILKDATATALYGARGANGVILVATKEGKVGRSRISFRAENTISAPTKTVELADPVTYMKLHNEAVATRDPLSTTPLPYTQEQIEGTQAGGNPYVYPAVDWRSELFKKTALTQRANFNVNGGGEVATYYVAGTLNSDGGIMKVNGKNNFNNNISLKSYSLRSNVGLNVTKTTQVEVRLYGSFDDYSGPLEGGSGAYRNVMRSVPTKFPAAFPDNPLIKHILFGNNSTDFTNYYLNPYANIMRGYREYSKSLMFAQFEIKQDLGGLVQGLTMRATGHTNREGYFDTNRDYDPFWHMVTQYDKKSDVYTYKLLNETSGTEYLEYTPGSKTLKATLYAEAALTYNRTFNKVHGISGLLITTLRNSLVNNNTNTLQSSLPYRNSGLAGRFTYSYDSRYFGEFNFGYNGSERFAKNERFGFFPSGGVAWYISNEKFMKPLQKVVSKLKLRGTYGLVGNDAIGDESTRFFYLSNVDMANASRQAWFGTESSYTQTGVLVSRYANPNITWETAKKMNIGLELGLFNEVDIQVDYFTEDRDHILMPRTDLPTTMGLSSIQRANSGRASASGVDMSVDYTKRLGNDLVITSRGNFTYATSKFKELDEPDYSQANSGNRSQVGHSLSQQFGYIGERLFVDAADVANSPTQNFGTLAMAGDIKYRDVNGDGEITDKDRVPIGHPTDPEIIYGLGFTARYKAFDFSAFAQGSARSSFWINNRVTDGGAISGGTTQPFIRYLYPGETAMPNTIYQNQLLKAYADDYWSEEDRNIYALWPRLSNTVNPNNNQLSTWFMRSGNFLRLKSVELGYTIPPKTTRKLRLDNVRVYVSGTNLATLSAFKLWDPEMSERGLDYPVQKVFNFGFQIGL